jgi:hypothetical protein
MSVTYCIFRTDMKVIALMPARNEAWILPTTLPQLRRFVDEIIVLDGHSTDTTREIIEHWGGSVIPQPGTEPNYSGWRQLLLDTARSRGGTHLVWLDADEAFTSQFLKTFRSRITAMKPGQKLVLDWLCLWKDPAQVRSDSSVWSINPKDFVFCDDGVSGFGAVKFHEGRTPGPNEESRLIRIPRSEGGVLHFQFVPFDRFQMKQAFMSAREWTYQNASARDLNEKYRITLDDPNARCSPIPPEWLEGLPGLEGLKNQDLGWFHDGVMQLFSKHGIQFFEPLNIWHIPELREQFRKATGRTPHPVPPPISIRIKGTINTCLGPLKRFTR